jgi:hypothetical protein
MTTILTNNRPRDLLSWHDLTAKERARFDWLETETQQDCATFFRYRGWTYCTDEFMTTDRDQFPGWHGYGCDSFFSGVLVRILPDEQIIAGRYYA